MAWVSLKNLFENDKNYHGLLSSLLESDDKFIIEAGSLLVDHPDVINKEALKAYYEPLFKNASSIKELIDNEVINTPEWTLNGKGELVHYAGGLMDIKGELVWPQLLKISIVPWLKKQPKELVEKIAEINAMGWKGRANRPKPITHNSENERLSDKEVDLDKYESFLALVV
jgi:hypothetical protein